MNQMPLDSLPVPYAGPVHYFATCFAGFAVGESRFEAVANLARRFRKQIKPEISRMQHGGHPGAYVTTLKVNAPIDAEYNVEVFSPIGVESSDRLSTFVTYLTVKEVGVLIMQTNRRTMEGMVTPYESRSITL